MTFYATAHFILTDILQALALAERREHSYALILPAEKLGHYKNLLSEY
jgi:hypothetical protein